MKHVFVTGGSRGLGLAIVRALLDTGYRVTTCSRRRSDEIALLESEHGADFAWRACDLGNVDDVDRIVTEAREASGEIHGLVNNAATVTSGVLATLPIVEIEKMLATNLTASIVAARAVVRNMLVQNLPGGRIVNISSIVSSRGYTGLSVYAASKAGLEGFTRALAREVGSRGITVNTVAPGYLTTEMSSTLDSNQRQQIVRRTPVGRLGTPEDIVPTVIFLLTDESRFITGQTIVVDGGLTC